ncbi:MAG: L-histidine N(alpha)-methyltransferase [Terriglobales bacterium]
MIARELIAISPIAEDVEAGLTSSPKSLPSKLFYDAQGSALFEEITRLPEYYPTRTELDILQERATEIAVAAGPNVTVVELGAGTATKTCTLLQALSRRQMRVWYVPVDISPAALAEARDRVEAESSSTYVRPVVADLAEGFRFLNDIRGRKLVLSLGSSIGNFDPEDAVSMLRQVRNRLGQGDSLLLGTDLVKNPGILVPAYDDAQGVTSKFNKNVLSRINRELDANFEIDNFRHIALWNAAQSRMEIYLESLRPQTVNIKLLQMTVRFRTGERIHTENSYKYTLPMVQRMLEASGFTLEKTWCDWREWFALHLARV